MTTKSELSPGWLLFLGIVQIVVGILAIALPQVMGMTVSMMVGIALCIAGGFQLVAAFQSRSMGLGMGGFLGAVLYLLVGILVLAKPFPALSLITLLAGVLLVFRGAMHFGFAFDLKPEKGWGWLLFSAIVSIILGVMVLFRWPYSALWFVGTVVGIELILSGWTRVFLSSAMKGLKDEIRGDA